MNYSSFYRSLISITKISVIFILLFGCNQKYEQPPNIIFFLVDDLGWSDVGCYGSDYYKTPHIDKLADEGIRFTNAYASCTVCSPTRASILTGKYPGRLRITHAIPIKGYTRINDGKGTPLKDADYKMNLQLEEVTIAEALKNTGYATAMMGKWHVCWDKEFYPEYQGFDLNVGGNNMGYPGNYFYPYQGRWRMADGYPWIEWNTLSDGVVGEYLTDRLTDEALKFIEKNKKQPFFLYLSHYAVHTPIQAKEDIIEKYNNIPADSSKGHIHPNYAAMIESVDQSMDALMKKLDDLNLTKNTIVIFTSDNGGHGKWTSNYPLRGNKGNFYEGGIRVPLIFKWPEKIEAGKISNLPVISTDFYPTLLEMANLPLMPDQHRDGVSLWSSIKKDIEIERDALYWHFPNYIGAGHPNSSKPCGVILSDGWKLIEWFESGDCELYHLTEDIRENNNIAEEMPDKVNELQKKLAQWRKNVNAQMPVVNPDFENFN